MRGAVTIAELAGIDRPRCTWPIGDPGDAGFGYCDAPRDPKPSPRFPHYCATHGRIAQWGRAPNPESLIRKTEKFLTFVEGVREMKIDG